MTTIDATPRGRAGVDTVTVTLPHHTQCQLCPAQWLSGEAFGGPIAALIAHHAAVHLCTCKTRTVRRCVGGRGKYETHTLTLVCETHRAVRCPECGSVLVARRCPRCDAMDAS